MYVKRVSVIIIIIIIFFGLGRVKYVKYSMLKG